MKYLSVLTGECTMEKMENIKYSFVYNTAADCKDYTLEKWPAQLGESVPVDLTMLHGDVWE